MNGPKEDDASKPASPEERTRLWSDLPATSREASKGGTSKNGESPGASYSHYSEETRRVTSTNGEAGKISDDPDDVDLPNSLQERYQLVRVLGKGGFANVYLAQDRVLDQDVAIKVLKLGRASKNDRRRFLFEARVGAKLRHPNIATIFDIAQTPDGLQTIMEYYPGGTLADMIKKRGALKPLAAIDVTRQVGLALSYAHSRDIIHRDVKPANIFMGPDGHVILGDFGIAASTQLRGEHTQTGVVIGTPLYMAPEQSVNSRDVDPRTDVYSLGLTLYHMLTGHPPRVLDLDLVPAPFRGLIKSAVNADRSQRMVSAQQFVDHLDQIRTQILSSPQTADVTAAPAAAPADPADSISPVVLDDSGSNPTPETWRSAQPSTGGDSATMTEQRPKDPGTASPRRPGPWLMIGAVVLTAAGWLGVSVMKSRDKDGSGGDSPAVAVAPAPTPEMTLEPVSTPSPTPETQPTASPAPEVAVTPSPSPALRAAPTPVPTPTPPPSWAERFVTDCRDHPRLRQADDLLRGSDGNFNNPIFRGAALTGLEEELRARPMDPAPSLLLGLIDYRSGRMTDAAGHMKLGLALVPLGELRPGDDPFDTFVIPLFERYKLNRDNIEALKKAILKLRQGDKNT